MFKSPILEWISHVHPITPLVVWGPLILALLWRSFSVLHLDAATVILAGASGLLVWSLTEYILHRFLFHFRFPGEWGERLHFLIHGVHHQDPVDPTRLVMPPLLSVILALMLFPFFRLALGPWWVQPFFALFLVGYLCYDYTHYAVHHFTPRTRFGKAVKQNHMIHHYVNDKMRWGVSSPVWDYVFGSYDEPVGAKKGPGKAPGKRRSSLPGAAGAMKTN